MERFGILLRKHRNKLLKLDNVVGVGLGYKYVEGNMTNREALHVFVKKKLAKGDLPRSHFIPEVLGEADTDVIEVGEIKLLSERLERMRPARPGVSIGHHKITAGTFGALVRDVNTKRGLILSNNHVLANATDGRDGRAQVGDEIYQPGAYDGGGKSSTIAKLERFIPIEKSERRANCPVAKGVQKGINAALNLVLPRYEILFMKTQGPHNFVDAAVARPLKEEYVTSEIMGLGPVKGVEKARIGLEVKKSGRTSGITQERIVSLSATMRVSLNPGESAIFYDQIIAGPMAQPGDSGALVVDERQKAVGLLFAGSELASIINPIETVLKLLKIELVQE